MVWPERKSNIQPLALEEFEKADVELFILRDDALDPEISGNKWRKLKYNILHAVAQKHTSILTFGGAFSNHLAATAAAGKKFGIKTIGLVRGETSSKTNPTLSKAIENGMELHFLSRGMYKMKDDPEFIYRLHEQYQNTYIVPEGGANYYGVSGCIEIMKSVPPAMDHVVVPCGTGTTLAGCLLGAREGQQVIGVPVLKGGGFIRDEVRKYVERFLGDQSLWKDYSGGFDLWTDYAFGGYAKMDTQIVDIIKRVFDEHDIILDGVYTAKAMLALIDKVSQGEVKPGSRVVFLHTGGVQGNYGLNDRYGLDLPVGY